MKKPLRILHTTEYITNHIVGKQHTLAHRKVVGGVIMVLGVVIAHIGIHNHAIISVISDLFGYSFHAIGIVPFIKNLENATDN